MNNDLVVKLLRLTFQKIGKDISHLSDTQILEKYEKALKMGKNIDVKENREEYLRIVYDIFEI